MKTYDIKAGMYGTFAYDDADVMILVIESTFDTIRYVCLEKTVEDDGSEYLDIDSDPPERFLERFTPSDSYMDLIEAIENCNDD